MTTFHRGRDTIPDIIVTFFYIAHSNLFINLGWASFSRSNRGMLRECQPSSTVRSTAPSDWKSVAAGLFCFITEKFKHMQFSNNATCYKQRHVV